MLPTHASTPARPDGAAETPAITSNSTHPKWTILNEEWVQVHCEIMRGPKGLSDRPVSKDQTDVRR